MKFTITLNGVAVEKEIATSWPQVTFRQLLELTDANELKALSVFTGIEPEILRKANITGLDKLLSALAFIQKEVPIVRFPKTILKYEVPYDIGFESFGQYCDIKDEIDKGKKDLELMNQYPLLCAIYTCKPYDFKEAENKVEEFFNAPCTEVLAVGNFILMKLIALRSTIEVNYQKQQATRLRRFRLALKAWLINTAFTVRFYILKKKLRLTESK